MYTMHIDASNSTLSYTHNKTIVRGMKSPTSWGWVMGIGIVKILVGKDTQRIMSLMNILV